MVPQYFDPGAMMGAVNASAQSGRDANIGNANQIQGLLNDSRYVLNPEQQLALQQQYANRAGWDEYNRQAAAAAQQGALGNQLANLSNVRAMTVNAQQNAANNVANQLAGLQQRAATSANAIGNAMNSVAGYIR